MTRRPPLPLAGRVARDVMGWEVCRDRECEGNCRALIVCHDGYGWRVHRPDGLGYWNPLGLAADLLDVIGALRERGLCFSLDMGAGSLLVEVVDGDCSAGQQLESIVRGDWRGALARAVCKAALEAVERARRASR